MVELPKTEEELQTLLAAKEKEVTDTLTAKHNSDMASQRIRYENDIKKAKEQANMTAEQIAQEKIKEQQEKDAKDLADLRAYKKETELSKRLAKEGLPEYLKNDIRLRNAEDGDLDKVIKDVKKDYEADRPKGATHSTVVQTGGQKPQGDEKQQAYEKMGKAIEEIIGR